MAPHEPGIGLLLDLGQYDQARVAFEQALAVTREVHDQRGEGWGLIGLGWAYHGLRQHEPARVSLEQALAIARAGGPRAEEGWPSTALVGCIMACASMTARSPPSSRPSRFNVRSGPGTGSATTLQVVGRVYAALGQYDRASADYEQALMVAREVGDRDGEGEVFGALMAVWHTQHRPRLAIFYGKQAINMFQEIRGHSGPSPKTCKRGSSLPKSPSIGNSRRSS